MKDPQIDPSNHFLGQYFKIRKKPFWLWIRIPLKTEAKKLFFFFSFLKERGQKWGQRSWFAPKLANTNPYLGKNSEIWEMLVIVEKDSTMNVVLEYCILLIIWESHIVLN